MLKRIGFLLILLSALGCGGKQNGAVQIETRTLEKGKALSIIEEMLAERGYSWDKQVKVQVAGTGEFASDYRVKGEKIAIAYLAAEDRTRIGEIPPPAEGSRLHVLSGRTVSSDGVPSRVYVLFIDDRKFLYHSKPNSEVRADVTHQDVDAGLRRDIADFLSWYEITGKR